MRMLTVHADLKILKTNYFSHVYKANSSTHAWVEACHLTGSRFPTSNIGSKLEPVYLTCIFILSTGWENQQFLFL